MNPKPELRPAVAADADAVADLWSAGWRDAHEGRVPQALVEVRTAESFRRRARDRVEDTVVATLDGTVVGFVMVAGDEVDQVYVAREQRGTGVAGALLSAAEDAVRRAGHDAAWLAVVAGNQRARRFYEAHGWSDGGDFSYAARTETGVVQVPCRRYVKSLDVTTTGA